MATVNDPLNTLMMFIFGLAIAGIPVYHLIELVRFRFWGVRVNGTVVEFVPDDDENVAVVRYHVGGRDYDVSPEDSSPFEYSLSQIVPVYYWPSHPEQALIVTSAGFAKWISASVVFLGLNALMVWSWLFPSD